MREFNETHLVSNNSVARWFCIVKEKWIFNGFSSNSWYLWIHLYIKVQKETWKKSSRVKTHFFKAVKCYLPKFLNPSNSWTVTMTNYRIIEKKIKHTLYISQLHISEMCLAHCPCIRRGHISSSTVGKCPFLSLYAGWHHLKSFQSRSHSLLKQNSMGLLIASTLRRAACVEKKGDGASPKEEV